VDSPQDILLGVGACGHSVPIISRPSRALRLSGRWTLPGSLIVCSTPIGNMADVSERLRSALAEVDVVYAEDTRRAKRLLDHLGLEVPLRSYFVANEGERSAEIAARLSNGGSVAIVTDAGTPAISDPGYTAVRAALGAGARVSVVPGPSAVTAALVASGLPSDRFVFEGFLPRRGTARTERMKALGEEERTIVLFSTKVRLLRDLRDLSRYLGRGRQCAVARELTKIHEEVWRGDLDAAIVEWSAREPRGEFTLVMAGRQAPNPDLGPVLSECMEMIADGATTSAAVRSVAARSGVNRRELYEAVVKARAS